MNPTSGTVVDGSSRTSIISGSNYGTLTGSEGGNATYTVTAHKHTGNSSSNGGCYTKANYATRTTYCGGCQSITSTTYCPGCVYLPCSGSFSGSGAEIISESRCSYDKNCTVTQWRNYYSCSSCGASYTQYAIHHIRMWSSRRGLAKWINIT